MFADRTFHRSGLCIMGGSEAVGLAVFALVKTALSKIDLTSPERLQDATIHHHIGVDMTLYYFIISFVVSLCVLMCVFAVHV